MDFYSRAWTAGAEQYGKDRAEKYGKIARWLRTLQVLGIVALVLGLAWLMGSGPE